MYYVRKHRNDRIGLDEMGPPGVPLGDQFTEKRTVGTCTNQNERHRPTNEDAHVHLEDCGPGNRFSFFAIYDGHGGREAVDIVEKRLHTEVFREIESDPTHVPECLARAFAVTDKAVLEECTGKKAGCTAAVALIEKCANNRRMLYTANAGDARVVLVRSGRALRLTKDHKANDSEESMLIEKRGGLVIRGKVGGVLAVSRAFGDAEVKRFITSEPYTNARELAPEDSTLILACDGLWDVCGDQAASESIQWERDPQKMAESLVSLALDMGTTDNVSVMCVAL